MADDLASALAQIQKLEQAYEPLIKQVNKLEDSNKKLRRTNRDIANSDGILEQQYTKTRTAIVRKNQTLFNLGKTLGRYTKGIMDTIIKTKDEQKEYEKSVPIITSLMIKMSKFTNVSKMASIAVSANSLKVDENTTFMRKAQVAVSRFAIGLFSLIGMFTIVSVGLMMLSAAFQGTESPILDLTKNLGPLHDAMQGMVMITTGEGEGGLSGAFNVLAAAGLVFIGVALALSGTVGILAAGFVIAIGAFQLIKQETGSTISAFLGAISVTTLFTASILFLKGIITSAGLTVMGAFSVVLGALAVAYAVATGYGSDLMAGIMTVISLVLTAGAIIAAVATGIIAAPVAIVAAVVVAVAFLAAWIYRKWDEISAFFTGIGDYFTKKKESTINGLTTLRRVAAPIIAKFVLDIITKARDMKTSLLLVVANTITAFKEAPGNLWNKLKVGLITLATNLGRWYNNNIANFIPQFTVPEGVPLIGGKTFGPLPPKIPALAKGGVVTSPTLAMVGEAGPEAVVPLNRASQFGKTDVTVNINVSGVTDRSDKRALAREISDIIAQEMRRNGGSPTRGRF